MTLDERIVALVTGSSRGIGRAIAMGLAARGARVVVNNRQREDEAAAALAALPGDGHLSLRADVSSGAECARLVAEVEERCGGVDLLVNNAAIYEEHDPRASDAEAWFATFQRTLAANLEGPARLSFEAVARMRRSRGREGFGRGRIVNISSRAAFRGEVSAPGYAASKAGLNIFGQSLAQALAPDSIYVFTLAPGWVDTEMAFSLRGPDGPAILAQHPLGRVARAGEAAAAAVWLALEAPAAMTGAIVDLNGASYLRT